MDRLVSARVVSRMNATVRVAMGLCLRRSVALVLLVESAQADVEIGGTIGLKEEEARALLHGIRRGPIVDHRTFHRSW